MTYLPKAAVGPAETFAASFFFGATPLAHKLSHFLSESEISSLVSGVISAALTHLGEPAYWAVHAASGVHIGLWANKAHADEALREYEGGTMTALHLAPVPAAPAVKPLEWKECDWHWQYGASPITRPNNYLVRPCLADRWVGQWMTYAPGGSVGERSRIGEFYPTADAAKAAAQADYEVRIRSALVDAPAPAADPVKEQMAETLRSITEGNLGDSRWQANYEKIKQIARIALAAYEKSTKVTDGITCEACGASLDVDKDFHTYTHDGVFLCHDCTWTYTDMQSEPETFVLDDSGDETVYHTAETAKKVVDDYIASGGTITDKIGYRAWLKEKDATHAPA